MKTKLIYVVAGGALLLFLYAQVFTLKTFMDSCLKDHKEYECQALYRQSQGVITIQHF